MGELNSLNKMVKLTVIILSLFILSCKEVPKRNSIQSVHEVSNVSDNDEIERKISFIKEFYFNSYGNENLKIELRKKYLSKELFEKIEKLTSNEGDLILDYDPFIGGQDYFSDTLLKYIDVKPLHPPNEFRINLFLFEKKGDKSVIDLSIDYTDQGNLVINNILSDEILNPKSLSKNKYEIEYYLSQDKSEWKNLLNNRTIEKILENYATSPDSVISYLIFTKNKNGSLLINTKILDQISQFTNRENSEYLFALENYQHRHYNNSGIWNADDFVKIQAYIFNSTFPLRKKYWPDKVSEWYGGKPEQLMGSGSIWRDNEYYGLDSLRNYESEFRFEYWE